ncbi:MAG: ATP-binding cassette domain-containing protein [Acidobacteriaceae bacterium]|nr:ATP-binding cassette domain-containing protein [Acidobacteriaceae bacterium]
MLEFALQTRLGAFTLAADCRFNAQWTVVFGPSGAGKTTLLRLLAGLERPQQGHIALDGLTLTDTAHRVHIRPGQRRVALVPQQPALFPHLTVAANVAYGLRGAHALARVDETLELVGAASLADRRPRDLSGGEAQRVALARALAPAPRLLLLDEPFSALDGAASDALIERLRPWLQVNRVQTILVTHDVAEAMQCAEEVALLRDGRIAAQGPPFEILAAERARLLKHLGENEA